MEIVAQYNSMDYLKKIAAQETGTTFKAQSILWMSNCKHWKRKPIKPVTLVNWQSYLDNHILTVLGSQPIAEVNNASMKKLVEVLVGKGLSPASIRHFDGRSIKIEQSVWRSDAQAPKTQNAYRIVDLHPDVAKLLSGLVGGRESAYLFCTSNGKLLGQSNILRRSLHPLLERLGINAAAFMPFADSVILICGITPPARTDFGIAGWDGVARTCATTTTKSAKMRTSAAKSRSA